MAIDVNALWPRLRPDADGLVVAVVQDDASGRVLMVGYMNADALAATLERGRVTFWSRSRKRLWEKGETSGNGLVLRSLFVDCDGDALLVRAHALGPTCHTGATSCFFERAHPQDDVPSADEEPRDFALAVLARVFEVILERQAGRGATNRDGKSYVKSLLDRGAPAIAGKLREEADELGRALADESPERVASEAADLLFHAMVGLAHRDVDLEDVAAVLARRFGTSGIDEKAGRKRSQDP